MSADETLVVAQGTFDLVHPGHVHYLRESAALGDRLVVIISRRANVEHKDEPILGATQRRDVVEAFDAVDAARLGHPSDIFQPIETLEPDIITLGHDQHHDATAIEAELADRGLDSEVVRIGAYDGDLEGLLSTSDIIEEILARYG